MRLDILYQASPDIRNLAFALAGYPAKLVSGASLFKTYNKCEIVAAPSDLARLSANITVPVQTYSPFSRYTV
jgi:hypothetical protein